MFSGFLGAIVGVGMYRGVQRVLPKYPLILPKIKSHSKFYKEKTLDILKDEKKVAIGVASLSLFGLFSYLVWPEKPMSLREAKAINEVYKHSYYLSFSESRDKERAEKILREHDLKQYLLKHSK